MVSSVVSSVVYVIFPVLLAIGLVRKYREYKWGKCKDFRSLHGKVFIVTGANSGIGKETAKGLALRQARVILACRDLVNANNVITEIRRTVSTGELIPMKLDLASLSSVHAFADDVIKDFPEIHTLINNAGVSIPLKKNKKTENGFEINFGVNHLGHFVLTNRLLPKLKESAPSRVIIVSSTLHEKGVIDFDNLYGEKGWDFKQRMNPAYANSKLANAYFGLELAKRLEGTGVDVFTVCPGFCYTKLFRHADLKWWKYVLFFPIAFFYLRSAKQGSQTILHCAVADLPGMSGRFFRDCKPYMSKHEFKPEISTKLWDVSEKLTLRV